MTKEDKIWIGAGVALALTGGIYYFIKKKKAEKELEDTSNLSEIQTNPTGGNSNPKHKPPVLSTPPFVGNSNSRPITKDREAENFRYSVGQEVMAVGFNGTKAYDARRMADGNYISEGIRKATFKKGDKIGKIIWAGKKPDGTYRYVVERKGMFLSDIYWIADQSVIKPIGKILPKIPAVVQSSNLDYNKLLAKGSKGAEVRKLQELLNLNPDGVFGRNTQNALFSLKKVKSIRLNDFEK